ncbi:hypothetical protein HNR60_002576 [Rhodopseudomonas rhenobacensis]|uniref:Uncharacterized protein n=1 Tax=Rhodopseudomonas rhenobacensis TaxID=87461 RepID=A0A7W7Z4I9_9BRAD|nr:hypothetical protein [Rhodopseudomonas rhenobacensis]MBB5047819.1 hypothetical protein [Rhodopseudomonas rhenobacensis]
MDTLHTVLRALRSETKSNTQHLTAFREFLAHLNPPPRAPMAHVKPAPRRVRRRPRAK